MRSVVAGVKLTKESAYADLAEHVNQKCGAKWDKKQGEARYKAYLKLFKETKRNYLNPCGAKYCISDEDRAKGIFTIEKKLEVDCPYYSRMDKLFGERQNILPSHVIDSGAVARINSSTESGSDSILEGGRDAEEEDNPVSSQSSETSDTSVILSPAAISKSAGKKKRPVQAVSFPDNLVEQCEASVAGATLDPSEKISLLKKPKKDNLAAFSEMKVKELELQQARLEWEQRSFTVSKEAEKVKEDKDREEATKRAMIVSLIAAGKNPEEIKNYLSTLLMH
jgi:hypothetical protein